MTIAIREAKDGADFAICMAIRMEVFVREQGVPLDEEMDEFDQTSTHYLATLDGKPVGTARTRMMEGGIAKIERVAVLKEQRGKGVGEKCMAHLIARLRNHPQVNEILIHAQLAALPFYEKMNFIPEGETFLDAGIHHRKMLLR